MVPDHVFEAVMAHRLEKVIAQIGQQPGPLLLDMIETETREWLTIVFETEESRVSAAIEACKEIEADRADEAADAAKPERSIGAGAAVATAESIREVLEGKS